MCIQKFGYISGAAEAGLKTCKGAACMEKTYSIKEVADMLGVSRDALRIYEEKGLFSPEREANGYRRYSTEDIFRLISIKFFRTNMIPINDIKKLTMSADAEENACIIKERIRHERAAALRHARAMEHLKLALSYYERTGLDKISCSSSNRFYRISEERLSLSDTVRDYFLLSSSDEDMCLCYLNTEYRIVCSPEDAGKGSQNTGGSMSFKPVSNYLILKERELRSLERHELMIDENRLCGCRALRKLSLSESPVPSEKLLYELVDFAEAHGLSLTGELHSHFISRFENGGKPCYLLELCAPLRS